MPCLECPPILEPTTCEELQLNRNILYDIWKSLNCLKGISVLSGRKCYEVADAVAVDEMRVPKADIPTEPAYCNVMLFWNGIFYQKESILTPSPLDWTLTETETEWVFTFNQAVGTEDDKCNLYLIIDNVISFGDFLCACDEPESNC